MTHVIYLTETERIKLYSTLKWVMTATVMTQEEKTNMENIIRKIRKATSPTSPKK